LVRVADTEIKSGLVRIAFAPHRNLSDDVNRNIVESEIEGGVHLSVLDEGSELEIQTENRAYILVYQGSGRAMLSGHPEFCPEPVLVLIYGSTWGGSMIRSEYIGRGMRLEFLHPEYKILVTSRILDIRERPRAAA
jgi:hypothetical protein